MRLRLVLQKSTVVNGGAPTIETRHYVQANAGSDCDADAAAFMALADKDAKTTQTAAAAAANKHWELRDCGGITVKGNPADFLPDSNNPLPTDGTAWTGGNPNDTDDQGKAVTYSDPNILIEQKTN